MPAALHNAFFLFCNNSPRHRSHDYAKQFAHLAAASAAAARQKEKDQHAALLLSLSKGPTAQVQRLRRRRQQISSAPDHQPSPSPNTAAAIQNVLAAACTKLPPVPHRVVDLAAAPASGERVVEFAALSAFCALSC